jgi:hypothetical protein
LKPGGGLNIVIYKMLLGSIPVCGTAETLDISRVSFIFTYVTGGNLNIKMFFEYFR